MMTTDESGPAPIGIVGGGAMGMLFAALFHRAGMTVRVCEKDEIAAKAAARGMEAFIDGKGIRFTAEVSSSPEIMAGCGAVFFFVKCHDTAAAARDTAPFVDQGAAIVSIQNGLGNAAALAAAFSRDRLVIGTTTVGATRTGPASVRQGGHGRIVIGGKDRLRVEAVRDILSLTGEAVEITCEPERAIWEKALVNGAINPVFAILGLPNGARDQDGHIESLQRALVTESCGAARRAGHAFDEAAIYARVREVCEKTAENRCSMLQDLEAGKRTEIDGITGAILAAAGNGLAMPVSETLYRLVKARETPGTRF